MSNRRIYRGVQLAADYAPDNLAYEEVIILDSAMYYHEVTYSKWVTSPGFVGTYDMARTRMDSWQITCKEQLRLLHMLVVVYGRSRMFVM